MQAQKQALKINNLLDVSSSFYEELLGYKPQLTILKQIPESKWGEFTETEGLSSNSLGIYLPRNNSAIINGNNLLSLFHEYFGHGLYCEKSLIGKRLVSLEKELLKEEKKEFKGKTFTLGEIQKFRRENYKFQELENFKKNNLGQYELFAIWTEYLLSERFGLKENFEKKYDSLSSKEREWINSVFDFSQNNGNLATFYAQGLARRTTLGRVKLLLENIYKNKLNEVKFALLYGSRKEFSDIDVFVVSDSLAKIRNNWLDVSVYSSKEFEKKLKMFDVVITDPLSSGKLLFGDKGYFECQKQKLFVQPITQEAIRYNLEEGKQQEMYSYNFQENSEWRKIGQSYALTSRLMAQNLILGKRIFTKKELLDHCNHDYSEELKGGRKNAT